jgi:hypothetical protein
VKASAQIRAQRPRALQPLRGEHASAESAGRHGTAALAPPRYGIDFVDRAPVLQALWAETGRFLRWDPAEENGTWWFDRTSRLMAFSPPARELSEMQAAELTWKPHKTWQKEALEHIDPDEVLPVRVTFEELLEKGAARWKDLLAAEGRIDPTTQQARDWFFEQYYDTRYLDARDTPLGEREGIESNYNARPDSYRQKVRKGEYQNAMRTGEGSIVSSQTYALGGPGEVYYNPGTGRAERMPPSEIYYQQWKLVAAQQNQHNPVLKVKRESVAGDALPMLRTIRTGAEVPRGQDATFLPGSRGFLAMLAIPNVTASVFLIKDHGRELGVSTITKIVLTRSSHLEVHFGLVNNE